MRIATQSLVNVVIALLAAAAVVFALHSLTAAQDGVVVAPVRIGDTPATVFRPAGTALGPVVLIAHGFAGSQQLMRSFALTFARNGYVAVTFDFPGHGRNPRALAGDITKVEGATKALVDELSRVAAFARGLGDGRLAALGHSMASDIVVRFAQAAPDVAATIAVSMFSPAVTRDTPRNLLVIVGDLEGFLKTEALRAIGLASPNGDARPGVTYGDPANGTARRAAFSAGVEHIGVLYSADSMAESLAWLDATFGISRSSPPLLDRSGSAILLLLAGLVALARPLSAFLPRLSDPPKGAGLTWRVAWIAMVAPAVLTPVVLLFLPTHFLPVIVGDYLAAHFATYGIIALACVGALRGRRAGSGPPRAPWMALVATTAAYALYTLGILGLAINAYVTSFVAIPERIPLIFALLAGTIAFFLADEWLTRGQGASRGLYAASKLAFLGSLAIAVALDFERLFFLAIIIPVIVPLLLVYGLFSAWAYSRTGNPLVAGLGNALAFAWAIGVTFPMLAS